MDEPTVYIVDDDEAMRHSLVMVLETAGFNVASFDSAERFLKRANPRMPCCILLDLRMPGMSGLDLQEELAERSVDVPIIFLTGHGSVSAAVRALKGGAVDFLEKPLNHRNLAGRVREAIEAGMRVSEQRREAAVTKSRLETLTAREREILDLIVAGFLNKQIAIELNVAEKTIVNHRASIMQKMGALNAADLARRVSMAGAAASGQGGQDTPS